MVKTTSLNFWDKIKYLFSKPSFFFSKVQLEKGIGTAFLSYLSVKAFISVVSFGLSFITIFAFKTPYAPTSSIFLGYSGLGHISIGFFGIFLGLLLTFIYSGLIHVLVKIFKGKGNFADTYKVYTYSIIPFVLLSIVPLVGFLAIFYSLVLMIIGISETHKISKGFSALACLLPAVLFIGFLVMAVLYFFMNFTGF